MKVVITGGAGYVGARLARSLLARGVLGVPADIYAPCALGGVVHDLSLENLKVRAIAGSANNVLAAPEDGALAGIFDGKNHFPQVAVLGQIHEYQIRIADNP